MKTDEFHGEKLRIARLFLGLSQAECARIVGTSRQFVHQIETGAKHPNKVMLEAFSSALGVTPMFFRYPVHNAVKVEHCHFRKLRSSPVGATRQALAHATLLESLTSVIDSRVELPVVDFPIFEAELPAEIERTAEKCRQHWGLSLTRPIKDMTRVIERAGGIVTHFGDLSEKIDAFSMSRARPIIVRNTFKKSICRMRFDLAHEVGHLILHQGVETGDVKTENEANRFASALLLPRTSFAEEFPVGPRINWAEIYKMKIKWKVSVSAIIRRAYDLGLMDVITYRRGNIYLNKTGQSKQERYDENIPEEHPTLLHKSLVALGDAFGIGISELSEILEVDEDFTKRLVGEFILEDDPSPDFPNSDDGLGPNSPNNVIRLVN